MTYLEYVNLYICDLLHIRLSLWQTFGSMGCICIYLCT